MIKKPKDTKKTIFLALYCILFFIVGILLLITGVKQFSRAGDKESASSSKPDKGYVFIRDWGVYIGLGEYSDKVSVSEAYPSDVPHVGESAIVVTVKPQYSYFQDCETSIGISRIKDVSDFDSPPEIKLGDYYYRNNGVSECGGAKESGNKNTVSFRDLINAFESSGVKE